MSPSKLAKDLIDFLRNPVNSRMIIGKWKRINGGGSLTDYKADFDNTGTTLQIWIWLNNGGIVNGIARHNPPHWFIRITDLNSKRQIHNMDLHKSSNHDDVRPNISKLLESGIKLGISTLTGTLIAYIDNTDDDWQKKAFEKIFDHAIVRLMHKTRTSTTVGATKAKTATISTSKSTGKTTIPITMPPRNTPFQDLVISCLDALLRLQPSSTDRKLLQRFKDHAIKPLVRHYPEITGLGETTNGNVELFKKYFKWSVRAVHEFKNYAPQKEDDKIYNYIKMEHIYPVSRIVDGLVKLNSSYTTNDIQTILNYNETINNVVLGYEIIIVSYQEADVLNGSQSKVYPLADPSNPHKVTLVSGSGLGSNVTILERLASYGIQLDQTFVSNSINLY